MREGVIMSAVLKEQVMKKVAGLSDDNLIFLSEMIDRFMKPSQMKEISSSQRIGIKAGEKMYADGYDFDEMNDQIADWFGGEPEKLF
jgi:uncharacterized protein (DUF2225 family)